MHLLKSAIPLLAIGLGATAAFSGGGTVTSTEPGPPMLAAETTDQMLTTMGIVPAKATTVETVGDDTTAAEESEETTEAETGSEPEIKVASTGPLDPRETVQQCATCHGYDGLAKIPTAPNIAGSSRGYLETQLKAFRSGKRENEVMAVIAEELSNAEIKAAAKWYASLKVTVEVPE